MIDGRFLDARSVGVGLFVRGGEQIFPRRRILRLVERHIDVDDLVVVEQLFGVADVVVVAVRDEQIVDLLDLFVLEHAVDDVPRRRRAELRADVHDHVLPVGELDVDAVALPYVEHAHGQNVACDSRVVGQRGYVGLFRLVRLFRHEHRDDRIKDVGAHRVKHAERDRGDQHDDNDRDQQFAFAFFGPSRHINPRRRSTRWSSSFSRGGCRRAW